MTVQELYEYAKEHNCLNEEIYKNMNLEFVPIEKVVYINDNELFNMPNMVLLD